MADDITPGATGPSGSGDTVAKFLKETSLFLAPDPEIMEMRPPRPSWRVSLTKRNA